MNLQSFDKLKKGIIDLMRKDESKLDDVYMYSGNNVYTRRDIIHNIEQDTDLGEDIIENLIMLTVELLNSKKINPKKPDNHRCEDGNYPSIPFHP